MASNAPVGFAREMFIRTSAARGFGNRALASPLHNGVLGILSVKLGCPKPVHLTVYVHPALLTIHFPSSRLNFLNPVSFPIGGYFVPRLYGSLTSVSHQDSRQPALGLS
jgi:hypothetical protein